MTLKIFFSLDFSPFLSFPVLNLKPIKGFVQRRTKKRYVSHGVLWKHFSWNAVASPITHRKDNQQKVSKYFNSFLLGSVIFSSSKNLFQDLILKKSAYCIYWNYSTKQYSQKPTIHSYEHSVHHRSLSLSLCQKVRVLAENWNAPFSFPFEIRRWNFTDTFHAMISKTCYNLSRGDHSHW